jgi:hypothetical protein
MSRSTFPGVLVHCRGEVTYRPLGGDVAILVHTAPAVGQLHAAQLLPQGLTTVLIKTPETPPSVDDK